MSDQTLSPTPIGAAAPSSPPPPPPGHTAAAAAAAAAVSSATTGGGQPAPPTIPLSVEEYQRLRALERQLEDVQRAQQAALEAKESERLRALAEKGQIEEALSQQRGSWERKHAEAVARHAELERQVYSERKGAVIADAFHGRAFVGQSAEQRSATAAMVRRLLEEDFETSRDASGNLVVREKVSGRPAAEVLRERLESPQFAIFFAPSARGGAGSDATRPHTGAPAAPPGSLDAIASEWRTRQTQYQSFGLHPRT